MCLVSHKYSWTLNNTDWTMWATDKQTFKINTINAFSLLYDFLDIFFSLSHFIIKTLYIIHVKYKICVNWLYMLSVRHLVNRRLLVVTLLGSQKLYVEFWLRTGDPPFIVQWSTVYKSEVKKATWSTSKKWLIFGRFNSFS